MEESWRRCFALPREQRRRVHEKGRVGEIIRDGGDCIWDLRGLSFEKTKKSLSFNIKSIENFSFSGWDFGREREVEKSILEQWWQKKQKGKIIVCVQV
jgi:hypothetical protein